MARRGLVSKSSGPQSSGSSALMPKGEKPKGPDLIPIAEVARRLQVQVNQVESWIQKDQLRGNDSGIRPYDYKKFQLDHRDEIKRAQNEAVQTKRTKSGRKPKKGFLSKFRSLFGGAEEGESDTTGAAPLAEENKKLKAELSKLKKSKSESKTSGPKELEEKIRFLEGKLSDSRALENEVDKLKRQLAAQPSTSPAPQQDHRLIEELEQTQQDLKQARMQSAEAERFREALEVARQEQDELRQALELARSSPVENPETEQLQRALASREDAYSKLQSRAQGVFEENNRLRAELSDSDNSRSSSSEDVPLVQELLDLQKRNLDRFKRLHALHAEAQLQLEDFRGKGISEAAGKRELQELQNQYNLLLAQQGAEDPAHREVLEQLSQTRASLSGLKQENNELREQMRSQSSQDEVLAQIRDLEVKLEEARSNEGNYRLLESELASLQKGLALKESQVQKVAARLADNEKRLAKALQESARLTELLIERENRLRELSTEFEQEYRDKMENLDRQVSGLQWKLSLREERIAHLESELLRKGD